MPNGMMTIWNKMPLPLKLAAGIFPVFWISFSLFPFTPAGEYGKLIDESISGGDRKSIV